MGEWEPLVRGGNSSYPMEQQQMPQGNSVFNFLRDYNYKRHGTTMGEYWEKDNAKFDVGNPNIVERAWRGFNPLTSLGSALGDVHTSASRGDPIGAVIGGADAMPLYALPFKTIAGTVGKVLGKDITKQLGVNEAGEQWQSLMNR